MLPASDCFDGVIKAGLSMKLALADAVAGTRYDEHQ
jgi:hypothetical protein